MKGWGGYALSRVIPDMHRKAGALNQNSFPKVICVVMQEGPRDQVVWTLKTCPQLWTKVLL